MIIMTEIMAWWITIGFVGFCLGTIIDVRFYKGNKFEWKVLPLCLLLGPIVWIVAAKVCFVTWWDKRKKRQKNKIPENLKECFIFLDDLLSEKHKEWAKKDSKFGIKEHHNLGRKIRNDWNLWAGGKLQEYFNGLGIYHADDMSGIILDSYHRHLNNEDIKLYEQVHFYIDYWEKENAKGK